MFGLIVGRYFTKKRAQQISNGNLKLLLPILINLFFTPKCFLGIYLGIVFFLFSKAILFGQ